MVSIITWKEVRAQQSDQSLCGTPLTSNSTPTKVLATTSDEGAPYYIPAYGIVRALVIYVQFPDDNTSDPYWPSGQLPSDYNDVIDPSIVQTYRQNTLSDFYRVMSNGTTTSGLNLIGAMYPQLVMAPHPMSYYKSLNENFGDVNRDVLASIDYNVNFGNYDNCHGNAPGSPDGVVDMIFIIYRYIDPTANSSGHDLKGGYGNWNGIATLGTGQSSYLTDDYNSKGQQVSIQFGDEESGVTYDTRDNLLGPLTGAILFKMAHEFGHYLFGSVHFGSTGGCNLMNENPCYQTGGMDAYERSQLGWITPITVSQDQTISLGDYYSTGSAVKIMVPGKSNEYFLVENRSVSNIYDQSPTRGVYITHIVEGYSQYLDEYNMELQTPNGFWDYALNGSGQPYKTNPDQVSGGSWLEYFQVNGARYQYPYTVNSIGRDVVNGNVEDAYNVGYAQVYSPWSNPSSNGYTTFNEGSGQYQRTANANFAIVLKSTSGTQANLSFYIGNLSNVSGTIASNTTWNRFVNVSGSVTLNSGATLTINPGTVVTFANGANLAVNGVLNAVGTAAYPITFTSAENTAPGPGSWGSILISGSGANGSLLNYANFQYGTGVSVVSANNVTIQNCSIANNSSHAIYLNNASGCSMRYNTIANSNSLNGIYINYGSNNNCYYNTIYKTNHNDQGGGIIYSSSSGTVGENDIDYCLWGIMALNGSSVNADPQPPNYFNNRVTNCGFAGLFVDYQSYCDFGNPPGMICCGNSIYGNTPYNASVGYTHPTVPSGLYAVADWWGTNNPNPSMWYVAPACYGMFSMPMPSDPWRGKLLPSVQSTPDTKTSACEIVASISNTTSQAQRPP